MKNYQWLKNNKGVLISLAILALFLPISISNHSGYKEYYINYFLIASFVAPIAPLIFSKRRKMGLLQALKMIILVIFLTIGYWWYRDLPQQTYCDGACGGQFSFENSIDYLRLIMAGGIGIVAGSIIWFVQSKLPAK